MEMRPLDVSGAPRLEVEEIGSMARGRTLSVVRPVHLCKPDHGVVGRRQFEERWLECLYALQRPHRRPGSVGRY